MIINKKIIGNSIYLRNLTIDDASEKYCSWLNDSEVNKYISTTNSTIDQIKKYILEKNKSKDCIFLGIFDIKNDSHIGNIKLEPIDFEKKSAIFSILIGDRNYWGKGVGTEATRLLSDYAFKELSLKSIELGVVPEHIAAIKVYEKVGFKKKGIKKKSFERNGIFYDNLIMEKLRD
jgi:RimJ/RimL family protein N-acetyltransferase